jgi:tRNA threonylcarbamoyladenosine biosynthesis protein TsaB
MLKKSHSRILAIENSSNYLSLAYEDAYYHCVHTHDTNAYILAQIDILLQKNNQIQPDYIAVGVGPGAFTGVRLAISTAISLAFAWSIPVIPICSLWTAIEYFRISNIQLNLSMPNQIVIDARMQQAYVRDFTYTNNVYSLGEIYLLDIPNNHNLEEYSTKIQCILTNLKNTQPRQIQAQNNNLNIYTDIYPHALGLLNLAYNRTSFACAPQNVQANYVRNKVAITIAERGEK